MNSTQQDVQSFRQLVASNKDLQDSVRQYVGSGQWDSQGLAALGREHDLRLTEEAVYATFSDNNDDNDDELTDFELEMILAGNPMMCTNT
uniref:Nif11 domain-containing protein n=1 Tax=uncultured Thiotrichaceae bacterium TaxID=298394 RepID=A0A6S6T8J5_9GAMM|nr:MAG: Unknown protein [uncultured Thiotrichaceae bacterium]